MVTMQIIPKLIPEKIIYIPNEYFKESHIINVISSKQ